MVSKPDRLDRLFIGWAFTFQIVLILHFALRKPLFESYTLKYGWVVYALGIPAAVISIILLRGGKSWGLWLGGFIFPVFAAYGIWVDYIQQIAWRDPIYPPIFFPYVLLYLGTVMFYWWPLGLFSRRLWLTYGVLFVLATVLNITSH